MCSRRGGRRRSCRPPRRTMSMASDVCLNPTAAGTKSVRHFPLRKSPCDAHHVRPTQWGRRTQIATAPPAMGPGAPSRSSGPGRRWVGTGPPGRTIRARNRPAQSSRGRCLPARPLDASCRTAYRLRTNATESVRTGRHGRSERVAGIPVNTRVSGTQRHRPIRPGQ